jgi:hypothetical protein
MGFTVTYETLPSDENSDHDAFEFLEGGVLAVMMSSGKTSYFAPSVWNTLTADEGHKPGKKSDPATSS